jgi:tetratricopeptide (TPR) repeat protein
MLRADECQKLGRLEEATAAYHRCLELEPNHSGALLGLGHMLKALGNQQESIAAYLRCLELNPNRGEVYYSLANLKTYQFNDDQILDMEARLTTEVVSGSSEVNFLFALAKAHEDRQDYSGAWRYYEEGNEKQRMRVNYDPVHTVTTNDNLLDFFTPEFFERTRNLGNPDTSPIFVLGMPRSGSTLVEQIIASHSQVEGTGELPYIGKLSKSLNCNRANSMEYPEALSELGARHFSQLGEQYLNMAKMHRVEGSPYFIDKMPNNFPRVGFIHAILPNAKIIDARRNPMDACVGNLKQLYARGQNFSYDQSDVGKYYLQYLRMMDHWDRVLPGRVLHLQYEDTVNDLENQVKRILAYLELPWEDSCINFHETDRAVRSASSEQVRQAIYTSGIGFWKNFEPKLEELKGILGPIMERHQS